MTKWVTDGDLRTLFHRNLRAAQWSAVESGMTVRGIPDSEYCFPGGLQGWIEFKRADANAITIRPLQVGWVERRCRLGGRVFVGVRRKNELRLFRGRDIRALAREGLAGADPVGEWSGSPFSWDWEAVERILKS